MTDDTQSAVLLPCPFCGSEAAISSGRNYYFVMCPSCLASTNVLLAESIMPTEAEAIAAWNTRQPTQSDALKIAVEAERERCAQIAESIISADQYDTMNTDCYQDTADRIAAAIRANPPMPYDEAVAYVMAHYRSKANDA